MNALEFGLERWVQTPGAAAIGRTLLHSLWEGAAVALALALALCVIRSSRARYAASCAAMVVLLSGLAVTCARLMPEQPIHVSATGPRYATPLPPGLGTPLPPAGPRPTDALAWLVPFWIAGVLIFHLRGVTSWMAARRLRGTGVCCAPDLWQERLDRLKARLRMERPVALLESCLAEVPVVIGYVRPIILMPVGLLAGLPVTQVEAILLHELAHIRRYDYLVNLMQVFAEGLLFYHPAVWWISGVMRSERENCCDDLVVEVTGGALEYATALAALEKSREPREDLTSSLASSTLAATGGSLVNRIQRLLGRQERRYTAGMPVFTAAILTITVVTAMAALQFGSAERKGDPVALKVGDVAAAQTAVTVSPARPMLLAQAQQAAPSGRGQQARQATQPDQVMFYQAMALIQSGNYLAARLTLNTLINTYDTSPLLIKAKLAIADSWFREGDAHGRAQAEVEYKDFILFYANTPEANEAKIRLESIDPYYKWALQDVAYIISDEERRAFNQLTTNEEREHFVEQFWARRDPTPGTPENEFKEEHYRRIAYANQHFTTMNVSGWRTDRGRIYIQYGPPDEIESHASGGTYERPISQGGGTTETFPFEQWRYRYIDGVGQNIIMEFVDTARTGDYRMTMDPSEKDALLGPRSPAR